MYTEKTQTMNIGLQYSTFFSFCTDTVCIIACIVTTHLHRCLEKQCKPKFKIGVLLKNVVHDHAVACWSLLVKMWTNFTAKLIFLCLYLCIVWKNVVLKTRLTSLYCNQQMFLRKFKQKHILHVLEWKAHMRKILKNRVFY